MMKSNYFIKSTLGIILLLLLFITPIKNFEAQSNSSINHVILREYNMSILSVNQNTHTLSIITAIKISNNSDKNFVPNFTEVLSTGMNFLRFSLPKGFYDLYVETDLPSGSLMEMEEGFALTSEIPPGDFNLIFSFYVEYNSSKFIFPLHFPHGTESFKIIIPKGSGEITGENISSGKEIQISSKNFIEYTGKEYGNGEYLNLEMTKIPTSFFNRITNSLNFQTINLIIILSMVNIIICFFVIRFFVQRKKQND